MLPKFTAAQAAKAEAEAISRGQPHLAETFRRMRLSLSSPLPRRDPNDPRPGVSFFFNNNNWCDGRLSVELKRCLDFDYRCRLVGKEDNKTFAYQDDLYVFRSAGRLSTIPPPEWAKRRTICILQSDRGLDDYCFVRKYAQAHIVVAQNIALLEKVRLLRLNNTINLIIPNGINTEEFTPASEYPEEFTVGAAGNFSLEPFDEWKGFGRYIVPACKLAKVKLRWCSWQGKAWSLPGVAGEQIPLDKMNDWYRQLSCLVSMSKAEGCSGVTFEAQAAGIPVISTKVGWHGEVCKDEILWANRPPEALPWTDKVAVEELAHQLWWLKNNPAAARALGLRGRKFAEAWPHSRVAGMWDRIFRAVLSGKTF